MEARGLTLLELIVALGIAAALAAIAVWRAQAWLPDFRLDAAARQVMAALRQTRAQALRQHRSRRLAFAPERDTYRRQQRAGSGYEDDGIEIALPPTIDLVDCSAAGDAIGFTARGTASTFGSVVLEAPNGRRRTVIVDIVGRVRSQ